MSDKYVDISIWQVDGRDMPPYNDNTQLLSLSSRSSAENMAEWLFHSGPFEEYGNVSYLCTCPSAYDGSSVSNQLNKLPEANCTIESHTKCALQKEDQFTCSIKQHSDVRRRKRDASNSYLIPDKRQVRRILSLFISIDMWLCRLFWRKLSRFLFHSVT